MEVKKNREIGRGAFAQVYQGTTSEGSIVAVKTIVMDRVHGEAAANEFRVLQRLSHPNVVRVLGYQYRRETMTGDIVMEFATGGSLSDLLKAAPQLEYRAVLSWTLQITKGLSYLHESHIIHRDIKPSNLLLFSHSAGGDGEADNADGDGSSNDRTPMRLKIGDFGLSRAAGSDAAAPGCEAAGTLRYMCASAVQGQASYAEDVYGLGCTVLEMATREQPWQGADPAFIRERVLAGDAPPQLAAMLRGSGGGSGSARAGSSGVQQQRQQRGLLAAFAARCVDTGLRRGGGG
eukprot:Rhum_TRINITY_DN14234_c1_g1::Rhum_TRINITY_DN14234_c1_g1_i1::g.74406::m.74406